MKNKKFDWEEQIGVAKYIGDDKFLKEKFGNTYHVVCNCEGNYVRDNKGVQYIIDSDWHFIDENTELE